MICRNCMHRGRPRYYTPGSFLIELVLWLFFIIPGLIYSLWRLSSRKRVCASCGQDVLVPVDSPMGRKLVRELEAGEG